MTWNEVIEALGQEPEEEFEELDFVQEHKKIPVTLNLTPTENAVNRWAILNKIKEVCFSKEWVQFRANYGSNGQRDFLINYIKQLPPIMPVKIGHWITLKDEYGDVTEAVCSCYGENGNHKWAFCPHCGVKMIEPPKREE